MKANLPSGLLVRGYRGPLIDLRQTGPVTVSARLSHRSVRSRPILLEHRRERRHRRTVGHRGEREKPPAPEGQAAAAFARGSLRRRAMNQPRGPEPIPGQIKGPCREGFSRRS